MERLKMGDMPQISVIVPVYRVETYLKRCIDSILGQSFPYFELILVDDGSPDRSPEICDAYAKTDDRIRVIHQKNSGVSAARNAGIEWVFAHSTSRWIAFVDGDDWLHKDYLQILYDEVQRSGTNAAVCSRKWVNKWIPDDEIEHVSFQKLDMDMAYSVNYFGCNGAHCKLLDRALFQEIRFPEGKVYEDVYILYRLLLKAGTISVCNIPLYYYFQNTEGITKKGWTEQRLDQIEAHEQRLAFLEAEGYNNAYKRCVEAYSIALAEQLQKLKPLCRENWKYVRYYIRIRRKFRSVFRSAEKQGSFPLNDENWGMYRMAGYPWLIMKIRYLMQFK